MHGPINNLIRIMVLAACLAPAVRAGTPVAAPAGVTEGEFSRWLVQVLGLDRGLPANPSAQQCFVVLTRNGIRPGDGWQAADLMTEGSLARVLVQAMGEQAQIRRPNDDAAYIQFLRTLGVSIREPGGDPARIPWEVIHRVFQDNPHRPPPMTPS